MSDTTAYLAGCATTGVAALVLLVARVGMVSNSAAAEHSSRLDERIERIESQTPAAQGENARAQQALEDDIRAELEKQRSLTQELEEQLSEQELLSQTLEEQLEGQDEKISDLIDRLRENQRSVEDMEIDDRIAAATRPPADSSPRQTGVPTSLLWLGVGMVAVLFLGGGGLILCTLLLVLQSQRRPQRPVPMPPPIPMPPSNGYRYYDQSFLPPAQPNRQATYYDYPPPYDYQ